MELYNFDELGRSYSTVKDDDVQGTGNARSKLNSPHSWIPKSAQAGEYLQIDLGGILPVFAVVTQGHKHEQQWVES